MPAQGLLVLAPMPPLPGFVPCRRTGRRPHHPAPVVYTIARRILEATKVGRPYPSSDAAQVGEARSGGPGQLRDRADSRPDANWTMTTATSAKPCCQKIAQRRGPYMVLSGFEGGEFRRVPKRRLPNLARCTRTLRVGIMEPYSGRSVGPIDRRNDGTTGGRSAQEESAGPRRFSCCGGRAKGCPPNRRCHRQPSSA